MFCCLSNFFFFFFLVQPKVWRCLLEQLQVQHGQLPAEDDDQLGHRLRCVVHACHAPEGVHHAAALGWLSAVNKLSITYITFYHPKMAGGRRRYPVRQQSQVSHCPSRRAGGFTVVRWIHCSLLLRRLFQESSLNPDYVDQSTCLYVSLQGRRSKES